MSTAYGIAAVTAVLRNMLINAVGDADLADSLGEIRVTALPPDRAHPSNGDGTNTLNLFIYRVSPNLGGRNLDLPARDSRGDRVANPPLVIDLHYLLTASGPRDFHAEILMGHAMQVFHESAILPREEINNRLAPPSPGDPSAPIFEALGDAELADQLELIKIVPEYLNMEELSHVWSAVQSNYRLTAAYLVTAVIIESRRPVRAALPVKKPILFVSPIRQPLIERVNAAAGLDTPITAGINIELLGQGFKSERTRVSFGEGIEVNPLELTDTRIVAKLPNSLRAGILGVRVVQYLPLGEPPADHIGPESNIMPLVLRPTAGAVTISDKVVDSGLVSGNVRVNLNPPAAPRQRVTLLLNGRGAASGNNYTFDAPNRTADENQVTFAVSGVAAGSYFVRVRVDGADSAQKITNVFSAS